MSPRNETVRVFVAVSISDEARAQLVEAVARIRREVPDGVQWANPDGMHLTLKFLGNIPAPTLHPLYECLAPVVDGHSPFPLELAGLGAFPNRRRPRVLWAGVTGDMNALSLLQLATEVPSPPPATRRSIALSLLTSRWGVPAVAFPMPIWPV